jgi:trehalose/maltose hydrolase-like predicted phosphorylase
MRKAKLLSTTERYLQKWEPLITHEQIFIQFQEVVLVHKKFERYLKKNKIKFTMPRKSKKHLERRRVFIHWYIDSNDDKTHSECVKDLERLLMISESTIYAVIYAYR